MYKIRRVGSTHSLFYVKGLIINVLRREDIEKAEYCGDGRRAFATYG